MYSFFSNEGISITQTVPSSIKPGQEFTVELNINRGTIAGFAKLQQELPEGCTAKVKESATGNFTFADRQVKIIWMSVPSDATFKISYIVTVPQNISVSTFDLAGKISYIENNEKKVFEIPAKTISVSGAASAASNKPAETKTTPVETASGTTPPPENTNTETPTTSENTSGGTQKFAAATSGNSITERTVTPTVPGKEYTVSVKIKKGTITGFAKLEEIIPAGLSASGIENASGVFSFVDGKAKYLWMSLPADAEFKVSYKLTVDDYTNPTFDLNGTFSYLENEETKKAPTPTSTVSLSGQAVAATTTPNNTTANNTNTSENTNTAANNTTAKTNNTNTNTAANNTSANNTTAAANKPAKSVSGIVYRVQVTAIHKSVPNSYFNDNYNIVGEIFSEQHEGWFKFTTGTFKEYTGARDKRVELSANSIIPGPFVTAYNSGRRITVQEALMVSNQKWVQ